MTAAENGYFHVAHMLRQDSRVELTAEQANIVDTLHSKFDTEQIYDIPADPPIAINM